MKDQNMIKELIREIVGSFILVLIGIGVMANVSLAPRLAAQAYNWNTIAFGWGFAYLIAYLLVGGVVKAHINPAVTLALAVRRDFPWNKIPFHVLAQIVGAFLGAAGIWFMYKDGLFPAGLPNIWATEPGHVYETAFRTGDEVNAIGTYRIIVACVAELFGTMIFTWAYLAARKKDSEGKNGIFAAIFVGLSVSAIGFALGGPSGFAINPARDLGPRLFGALIGTEGLFVGWFWIFSPIIIPFLAGPLGAWLFGVLIGNEMSKKKKEID